MTSVTRGKWSVFIWVGHGDIGEVMVGHLSILDVYCQLCDIGNYISKNLVEMPDTFLSWVIQK